MTATKLSVCVVKTILLSKIRLSFPSMLAGLGGLSSFLFYVTKCKYCFLLVFVSVQDVVVYVSNSHFGAGV